LTQCLNCGATVAGKYCHVCGQKAQVKRLTAKVLFDEVVHFFTHVEETFFKTSLLYIIKPGITSLNYVEGKRKRYQKPVSFFLIWTGVYILLHNLILSKFGYELVLQAKIQSPLYNESNKLFREHFSFFMLPLMVASAFLIWLVMARPRFYFFEIFTIVLYGGATYFILCLISDIILGVIFRININHYSVFIWQTILSGIYNIWFTYDFFRQIKMKWFWPRLILSSVLISVTGYMIMMYVPLAWVILTR
jgi:hypothetical protein